MITTQNTYAIYAMCAIVITCYALRNSEAHYLPDLLGLALALAAPRQELAIASVGLLAIVRHTGLAHGLAESVPQWLIVVLLPGARNMSIPLGESIALESAYKERISEPETNLEYTEIPQPVAEKQSKILTLRESEILARLVLAKKVGLTEAVQIGAQTKSGERYSENSTLVKAALERLRNHYPPASTHKRFE